MSNLLIVESINDKYFIEALVKHINIDIKVNPPICKVDDYQCLAGGIDKLERTLIGLRSDIEKSEEKIEKIGIILDADNIGISERKDQIQQKITSIFGQQSIVEFSCYIMNKDGTGELETLLRSIKSKESIFADCLETWQACLPDNKKIRQKHFDKFWLQIYQTYDCCTGRDKYNKKNKCNNEISLKGKQIYNFDADIPELNALKDFLYNL